MSLATAAALAATPVAAAEATDLADLSLEDLLTSQVTSVAKRPQTVEKSAAAIFVISREDIRRSGAATIPEALRMAPGMEVATMTGGAAGVTVRGFNGVVSNKLLILVDGRPIYLSTVEGVVWNQQLLPMEDIERIEIVRGPGATLWGANAVNGVINIISRHAVDSLGASLVARTDTEDQHTLTADLGVTLGGGALRLYVTGRRLPASVGSESAAQGGFRYDIDVTNKVAVTLQGDVQSGHFVQPNDQGVQFNPLAVGRFSGANLLARWTQTNGPNDGFSVQAYWDQVKEKAALDWGRDQFDIEGSRYFPLGARQAVITGAGYRYTRDRITPTPGLVAYTPEHYGDPVYSAFVQDDIAVAPDRVTLSLGAKLEHNSYTGFEFEPSARVLVRLPTGALWASVSRAIRTPSRFEESAQFFSLPRDPHSPAPLSERLTAYELGWRGPIGPKAKLDIAAFYNVYDHLLAFSPTSFLMSLGRGVNPALENFAGARGYGVDGALEVRPAAWWTLKAAASWLDLRSTGPAQFAQFPTYDLDASPHYQASLRSNFDLTPNVDFDLWLRRVGPLKSGLVPAYTDLDLRLAWRPRPQLELSVQGRHLLDERRFEFGRSFGIGAAPVARALDLKLAYRY